MIPYRKERIANALKYLEDFKNPLEIMAELELRSLREYGYFPFYLYLGFSDIKKSDEFNGDYFSEWEMEEMDDIMKISDHLPSSVDSYLFRCFLLQIKN